MQLSPATKARSRLYTVGTVIMYLTKPRTLQGFYSVTRLSRRIYFWVVWRAINNINDAAEPDVFGVATSSDEALQQVQICLKHAAAIDLGSTFAQHWHKVLSIRTRNEVVSVEG